MSDDTAERPEPAPAGRRDGGTQAIDRALAILFAFDQERPERRVLDLSRELGLNKSTVYRLLQALAAAGLVRRDEDSGTYRLAAAVLDLAGRFLGSIDLRREARPHIDALVRSEGESVNLAVLHGRDAISIDHVRGTRSPQLVSQLGRRIPIYCSAAGKALILDRSEDEVQRLLSDERFPPLTPATITSLDRFIHGFRIWRARGWAMNDEESEPGIRVIAAPVRDHTGSIVASVSVSAPSFRLDDARVAPLADAVVATAAAISAALGAGVVGPAQPFPSL